MAPTAGDVLFVDASVLLTAMVAPRSEPDAARDPRKNADDFATFNEIEVVAVTDVSVEG